jgi:hypothetical protein
MPPHNTLKLCLQSYTLHNKICMGKASFSISTFLCIFFVKMCLMLAVQLKHVESLYEAKFLQYTVVFNFLNSFTIPSISYMTFNLLLLDLYLPYIFTFTAEVTFNTNK